MDDTDPRELEIRALKDSATGHFHDQDFDLAFRDVDRAVQLSEELDGGPRASLLSRRAYFRRRCGNYALAEKDVLEALRLEPNEVKHWLYLSNIFVVQKKYEEVLWSAKRVVELDPEHHAHAYSLCGQALCALGRFSEGLRAHDVAVQKNRGHGALHLRAASYVEMGFFRRALTDIGRSLEICEYPIGFDIRGTAHLALGNYSLAIPDFSRVLVIKGPKTQARLLWRRTFCLCHEKRYGEASEDLVLSHSHSPEFPGLRSDLRRFPQIGPDFLRFLPNLRQCAPTQALKAIIEDELRVESVRFLNDFLGQSESMFALVMFGVGQVRTWRSFLSVLL